MGGIFGVASKTSCTLDLFFGIDYHSHLGTRRGGMAVYGPDGFQRSIHNIENSATQKCGVRTAWLSCLSPHSEACTSSICWSTLSIR